MAMDTGPFTAFTVVAGLIAAVLQMLFVSRASHIVHGKEVWHITPVGLLVGSTTIVAELPTDHCSFFSIPGIIAHRTKDTIPVGGKDIAV